MIVFLQWSIKGLLRLFISFLVPKPLLLPTLLTCSLPMSFPGLDCPIRSFRTEAPNSHHSFSNKCVKCSVSCLHYQPPFILKQMGNQNGLIKRLELIYGYF